MIKKCGILFGSLMLPAALAYAGGPPKPLSCLSIVPAGGQWNETLTILNHCPDAIDFRGAMIKFDSSKALSGGFWGSFHPLAYPQNHTLHSVAQGSHYVVTAVLNFPEGNKWWKPVTVLPVNGQISMSFSVTPSVALSNFAVYASGPVPPLKQGEIDFSLPTAPSGVTGKVPEIVVQSDGGAYQTKISDASWGKSYQLNAVPYGDYTISVANAHSGSGVDYTGEVNPSHVVIDSAKGLPVSILFKRVQAVGSVVVDLPQQAVVSGVAKPMLHIQNLTQHKTLPSVQLSWNTQNQIENLPAGDQYALSTDTIAGQYNQYTPQFLPSSKVTVVSNRSKTVTLKYQKAPVKTEVVSATISGLPNASDKVSFTFTDDLQHSYQSAKVGNGHVTDLMNLPQGRQYTVSAETITVNGKSYTPTLTPSQFALGNKLVSITAKYQAGAHNFVAYWAGWSAYDLTALAKTKVNVVNLSFANIVRSGSGYKVDTSVSGYITDVPKTNSQMWPNYIEWTKYAYAHPQTKFMLSVGGATFSAIWTNVLTEQSVTPIAEAIVAKLKTAYPVYSGNFAYPDQKLGTVKLAGVDIDAEAGGARISTQQAKNISMLINEIKRLDPNTLVTLAGFSVGADPDNSQCTVPGSAHCGETVPILQQAGKSLAWVNVMAYDAGEQYAASRYKEAMANYAKYVGKKRAYLGLDLQPQWGVAIPETPTQLANKAKWAKAEGYGGIMFWAIMNNNPGPYVYLDKISEGL